MTRWDSECCESGDFPGSPVAKTPNAEGAGLIPDRGSQDPTLLAAKKPKQKQYCNKLKRLQKWSIFLKKS